MSVLSGFLVLVSSSLELSLQMELRGFKVIQMLEKCVLPTGSLIDFGSFRKLGVPYFGVLIIRILLFRVLY